MLHPECLPSTMNCHEALWREVAPKPWITIKHFFIVYYSSWPVITSWIIFKLWIIKFPIKAIFNWCINICVLWISKKSQNWCTNHARCCTGSSNCILQWCGKTFLITIIIVIIIKAIMIISCLDKNRINKHCTWLLIIS